MRSSRGTKPDQGSTGDFRSLITTPDAGQKASLSLSDGSRIAVIGGGPAGSFFGYFTLMMAQMLGRDLDVTIFEPKDFLTPGPGSCNRCGGVISELMVQTLAVEGINIPSSVIQRGLSSYELYTELGDVSIETPTKEKTIASVYRGGGPQDLVISDKDSFDAFLLRRAVEKGARHCARYVDRIAFEEGKPVLFSGEERLMQADLVVGAFGVNTWKVPQFEGLPFRYHRPRMTRTAIAEIALDPDYITERYGNSVQLFLLPVKNVLFAAIIPKRSYVTLCILGKAINRSTVDVFLAHPKVRALFPEGRLDRLACMCLPMMNVGAPRRPYADRIVFIGDSGSTRLYKDGIGGAYFMAKSAVKTVIMNGVSRKDFAGNFMPDYRSIRVDNRFGRFLFWVTSMFRKFGFLNAAMLEVVDKEQADPSDGRKILSAILWDMFTGNERYRSIFFRAIAPELVIKMTWSAVRHFFGGSHDR
ncbi:MAG: hypothetical protein JSV00_10435 [bacterium]|nr:MAG: hypothetical protein JSV00_10435 [bacterium]